MIAIDSILYGLLGDVWGLDAIFISLSIATFFTIPVIWIYIRTKASVI